MDHSKCLYVVQWHFKAQAKFYVCLKNFTIFVFHLYYKLLTHTASCITAGVSSMRVCSPKRRCVVSSPWRAHLLLLGVSLWTCFALQCSSRAQVHFHFVALTGMATIKVWPPLWKPNSDSCFYNSNFFVENRPCVCNWKLSKWTMTM